MLFVRFVVVTLLPFASASRRLPSVPFRVFRGSNSSNESGRSDGRLSAVPVGGSFVHTRGAEQLLFLKRSGLKLEATNPQHLDERVGALAQ